jgi:hypothetical protein
MSPPQHPPAKPFNRTTPLLIIFVGFLVLLLIAVAGFIILRDDADPAARTSDRTASARTPAEPPSTAPGSAKPGSWQQVVAVKHGLTYNVPPAWKVETSGTIVGFEDANGKPLVGMGGVAGRTYKSSCQLVRAGVTGGDRPSPTGTGNLAGIAKTIAEKWAVAGYTPKAGKAPTVKIKLTETVRQGGLKGSHVRADITLNGTHGTCDPPAASIDVLVFPAKSGNPIGFIMYADRGVDLAVSPATLRAVLKTVRAS